MSKEEIDNISKEKLMEILVSVYNTHLSDMKYYEKMERNSCDRILYNVHKERVRRIDDMIKNKQR